MVEVKLTEQSSPIKSYSQESSETFALILKLLALESVHPETIDVVHDPSSIFAFESYSIYEASVHPK